MKRKKILIFSPRFPPQSGGSAIYFSNLVEGLSDQYEFVVITFQNSDCDVISEWAGATVCRIIPRFKSLPSVVRLLIESTISFLLAMYVLNRDCDLVHVHAASYATPGITVATVLWRTPIIYDCRDELFPAWLVKIGQTPVWFSCAPNVDEILTNNGISDERIVRTPVVNPHYVSTYNKKMPRETNNDGFNVIYVGRLIEEKGVPLLLSAFEEFSEDHPDAHLTLIGDDPTGTVMKTISKKRLGNSLTAVGQIEHRQVIEHIANSDVLVLPSYNEALPRVIIEAFELGVPVIAAPVGSVPNLVIDGETGLLIEHTVPSLISALEQLHEDKSLQQKIAENARRESEAWDWSTVVERVRGEYDRVS